MGLLLACDRRIPDQVADLRQRQVEQGRVLQGARPATAGRSASSGWGRSAGKWRARAQAFGMQVVAWSRNLTHEEADRLGIAYAQTPLEVARLSDVGHHQRRRQRGDQAPGERASSWRR